jgi:predicted nucleic acid-binding protein
MPGGAMTAPSLKVFFDCVVFAQAIINDRAPAGSCLELARSKTLGLIWSDYVLAEIRELPEKLPARLLVTADRVDAFLEHVATFAEFIAAVAPVYQNPFNPDDSH